MLPAIYIQLLQPLGLAIINSLWMAALVWMVYVAINTLFNLSSSKKYILAVIGELLIFSGFIISFIVNVSFSAPSNSTPIFNHKEVLNKPEFFSYILPAVSFAYLMVLIVMLIKWSIHFYKTQQIYSKHLNPYETKWQQWIEQKAQQLNIKKSVKIFVTQYVYTPLTIGIIKPVILLPAAIVNQLTVKELEVILLHELAHIKRADYLMNILLSLIETILYFNPFIFYFKKIIKRERENICDDEVLLQQYTPILYAESLLKLAKFSLSKREIAFAMSAVNNHQQQLLQRIKRITQTEHNHKNRFPIVFSLGLMITSLLIINLLYTPLNQQKNHQQHAQTSVNTISTITPKNTLTDNTTAQLKTKRKKDKILKTSDDNLNENLNLALQSLKQVNIPSLQNNIEEYRKNLSGQAAQQLADDNLKQRIKNYVSVKNISIHDFIRKIDSVKYFSQNNSAISTTGTTNNSFIIPASYIEKDSLNQYIQQHKQQIKHFVVIPNSNAAPYYLIVHSINENKEPVYIFIPYTPEQPTVD